MKSCTVRLTTIAVLLSFILAPVSSALVQSGGYGEVTEERSGSGRTALSLTEAGEPAAAYADALDQLPLHFIENQGQQDEQVAYYAQQGGARVFFTATEAVTALPEAALRQRFVGAHPGVRITGAKEQEARFSVFRGDNGERSYSGIAAYAEVVYRDLYPGVDLTYTGSNGALQYELVVQPGTEVEAVRLAYAGAEALRLAEDGDLMVVPEGAGTPLRTAAPTVFQDIGGERRAVDSAFALHEDAQHNDAGHGHAYGFAVGQYDRDYPLVIQSCLHHSTFLGGGDHDEAAAITVDSEGNVYVAGETRSSDFPTTAGAYDETHNGDRDVFVSVFDPTLSTFKYSTLLGGERVG